MKNFPQIVHELTRDSKTFIERANGERQIVDEKSLLQQLQEAKTMRLHTGGGSSGGSSSPLGLEALDIETDIERTVTNDANKQLPLPVRVQVWSLGFKDYEQAEAYDTVAGWNERIRNLFVSKFPLNGDCPECGVGEVFIERDGEIVKRPALMVTVQTETAVCAWCSSRWVGAKDLHELSVNML